MIQNDKKRALGRGLSALIPQAATTAPSASPTGPVDPNALRGFVKIAIEDIRRDSDQPRKVFDNHKLKELADSIKEQGVIQPVLVRRDGKGYRLIAGERRWRAAQLAGLKEVPAVVREVTEAQAFEMALVENLQRSDLNPVEEAEGYKRLMEEYGLTQELAAQKVGKDRSTVANSLRLLVLPEEVKDMLGQGVLDMGHARALLGLSKPAEIVSLARTVAVENLSVRETERRVKSMKPEAGPNGANGKALKTRPSAAERAVIEDLQRSLGTKVKLNDRGGKGSIEVEFYSYEDLDRLLALLQK